MTLQTRKSNNRTYSLDLLSTSQKRSKKHEPETDIFCLYGAPFFAYQIHLAKWGVVQGCCNHWDCPRCGKTRARQEYGRIVAGIRSLALQHPIYFVTITCRGKEMALEESEKHYLEWTNRLFSSWRARTKCKGGQWHYVQVTERQTRGHPHSHILTTANPQDLYLGHVFKERTENLYIPRNSREIALRSDWLQGAINKSGLGSQYDISIASSPEGASRYVAKYLFKPTIFENSWPKKWKRVRYSHSFPKLPERQTDAIVLLSDNDWRHLARRAEVIEVKDTPTMLDVNWHLRHTDIAIRLAKPN
jgi:hypothetical protein